MNSHDSDKIFEILSQSKDDIALMLGSLAHEIRLQIIQMLSIDERDFNELMAATGLSKTALVHHLNKLVTSGVLDHVERGRYILSEDGISLAGLLTTFYETSQRRKNQIALKRSEFIQRIHSKTSDDSVDFSDIRVVELPPMRVAYVRVISKSPENDAWAKMAAWAEPLGLLANLENHPVYGFNNPNPSPGSKEYGYEFWIRIGPDIEPEGEIRVKEFKGGLFAVATSRLKEEMDAENFKKEGFLNSWRRLQLWLAQSKDYKLAKNPGLERSRNPTAPLDEIVLDLHMPIRKRGRK
ncbi:MAG: effector binding domain-containing protein [Candidatus Thorarchaeota archaeon]